MSGAVAGRIGPNVLIQTASALETRVGRGETQRVLWDATHYTIETLPSEMVSEAEANALMRDLVARFGRATARSVMRDAGRRTGDYLLANRIPAIARLTLPLLPGATALKVLLSAIGKHTWTFAGSASVRITPGDPAVITIHRCPMCAGMASDAPTCDFYTGTFERLVQVLIGPAAYAEEVSCEAHGDSACRFLIGTRNR